MPGQKDLTVLGIESSCDDTAVAVLRGRRILSNIVSSQDAVHGPYGGIVPELASRQHIQNALPVLDAALEQAHITLDAIEGIAVTAGPGLVGSLLVGVSLAKSLAFAKNLPLIGINHLEGHLLAVQLEHQVEFPFLCVLVSGGHTSLYLARDWGRYQRLGATRDDAAGEAFDKGAKMLGLGYPGGRIIDELAKAGRRDAVRFPRARIKKARSDYSYDFSYSGLKTALRQFLASPERERYTQADIAASYQEAVVDTVVDTTLRAARDLSLSRVVVSGGVSANSRLRQRMTAAGEQNDFRAFFPSLKLCTDNAAMIAFAGAWRLATGQRSGLELNASAVLPLEDS
jgi:N6-L-threonylcarbamoyladenine synthase